MLRTRLLTATAAIALFGAGPAFAQDASPAQPAPAQPAAEASAQAQTPASTNTVVDVLRERGEFSTLLSALDAAQLTETLRTQPAVSIFAPTDAAFAALPEAERTRLLDPANVNELRQLLLYHVIVADVNSSQIEGALGGVETAARTQVQLDGTGDAIKVDAATVTQADIDAGNGAIFVIDRVLNPAQSLVATGDAEEEATPPVSDEVEPVAPADDATMTDDGMQGDMDAGEVAPPSTNPAPQAAAGVDAAIKAPNGEVATSVETVASPPVPNPTDGQQDDTTETEEPQS
ncbi:fasciclin domain-containing protein [Brevundimonas sp. AAP58]|uniref:fasciclin domain-containing protein n=1 Tax=Brevundimonas sp. AAP58 TaxID=1523422 RepID=UPI0006B9878B|nr:fasciclin domain-containing protein [Brevundimonas sp. AAP58]